MQCVISVRIPASGYLGAGWLRKEDNAAILPGRFYIQQGDVIFFETTVFSWA